MATPYGPENAMLPIILNSLFTRNRKNMAAAEKARSEARRHQRVMPREAQGETQTPPPAEAKPSKTDRD